MQVQCKTCNKMFVENHLTNHIARFNNHLFCNEEGCLFSNKNLETIVMHGQIKHNKIFKNDRQLYIFNCLQHDENIKNNLTLNTAQVINTQVLPVTENAIYSEEDMQTHFFLPDLVKLKLDKISKY